MSEYPVAAVRKVIDGALRGQRSTGRRRTRTEAAAERLVDAIAVLMEDPKVDAGDRVAFEDARAAVDQYRQEES